MMNKSDTEQQQASDNQLQVVPGVHKEDLHGNESEDLGETCAETSPIFKTQLAWAQAKDEVYKNQSQDVSEGEDCEDQDGWEDWEQAYDPQEELDKIENEVALNQLQ